MREFISKARGGYEVANFLCVVISRNGCSCDRVVVVWFVGHEVRGSGITDFPWIEPASTWNAE